MEYVQDNETSSLMMTNRTMIGVKYGSGDDQDDIISSVLTDEQLLKMMGPIREEMTTVVPMAVVYIVIFLTGVIGNVCTCLVIYRNRYMHTATNFYLFSLAISDLLLLLLGLPAEFYELWYKYPYVFGETFCVIRGLCAETSSNASILTITAFTVERYIAICHPIRSHTMSRPPRAVRIVVLAWVVATLCAVPLALQFGIHYRTTSDGQRILQTAQCTVIVYQPHTFVISTILFFCLPTGVIMVLYVLIGVRLRRSSSGGGGSPPTTSTTDNNRTSGATTRHNSEWNGRINHARRHHGGSSRRAVINMLVCVVVSFVLCWSPFHAQRLVAIYGSHESAVVILAHKVLLYISGVTYYLSATINPILYHIMSVKFRQAFSDTFVSCCRRARRNHRRRRTRHRRSTMTMTTASVLSTCTLTNNAVHHQHRDSTLPITDDIKGGRHSRKLLPMNVVATNGQQ